MFSVNEKSTAVLTVSFKDENGIAVAPSSGTYTITDVDSGTVITASTPFTPSGTTHDLTITPTENRILTTSNLFEKRKVTVTFTYLVTKQGTAEYIYLVNNLGNIT